MLVPIRTCCRESLLEVALEVPVRKVAETDPQSIVDWRAQQSLWMLFVMLVLHKLEESWPVYTLEVVFGEHAFEQGLGGW